MPSYQIEFVGGGLLIGRSRLSFAMMIIRHCIGPQTNWHTISVQGFSATGGRSVRAVQRSIHDAHGEDCTDAAEGDAMPTI